MPTVSIITPCYNYGNYIVETIQSILRQNYKDWECVIIDDASTDSSLKTIREAVGKDSRFQIVALEKNGGLANARNEGIKVAKGRYILPLDADDLISPDYLVEATKYLDAHPECPVVYGKIVRFTPKEPANFEKLIEWKGLLRLLHRNNHNVTAVFRKEIWEKVGGFNVKMRAYEDWDFWIKVYHCTGQEPHALDVESFWYRQHPNSLVRWGDEKRKILIDLMKESNREIYREVRPQYNTNEVTHVMIPFFKAPAQGRELEFTVKGWRRYCQDPFKITLVGDYHPIVETGDDIEWLECPRIDPEKYPGQYVPHIDHINKMRAFMDKYPKVRWFVRTSDDETPINDFNISLVQMLKLDGNQMGYLKDGGAWERDEAKTRDALKAAGFPTRGWVTHLPIWYDRIKLDWLIERFDLTNQSYVLEDLYFNIFYPSRIAVLLDQRYDYIRCGVWRDNPDYDVLKKALLQSTWMPNGVKAYTPEYEKFMCEYFNL